jgi:nicotinate phosphoribosyltransferase
LAQELGLTARGTMAHAYLQAFQGLGYRLEFSQKEALEAWVREYRGDLGIALTDVIGIDAFLADLDLYFAKLFDGFRWDSGKPVMWGWKVLNRLNELKVDPKSKTPLFTDGLDDVTGMALHSIFKHHFKGGPSGIGTFFTNDLGFFKAPNQVMKLVSANGNPVAKISDSPGKGMCDDKFFMGSLRRAYHLPEV